MKKNLLFSVLVVLFYTKTQAQCPPDIVDVDGDGLYYTIAFSNNATCMTALASIGGTGASLTLNSQAYGVSALSCDAVDNQINLSSDATPVVLAVQPVTMVWNSSNCMYNIAGMLLPIELISFTGRSQNNQNLLQWATASESQNKGFDIEASPNPSKGGEFTWRTIGFVAGKGTTNERQNYRFVDDVPSKGVTYYRLKQLDEDGRFEYSKTIAIDSKGEKVASVFPNPSTGIFTITGIEDTEDETFTLINSIGQTLSIAVQNDGQMDMSGYPSGVYYLRVASNGQVMKLVKE